MIILPWIVEAITRQEALERSKIMGKHPQQYIHNVARTIIGQIGGVPYSYSNISDVSEVDETNYPQKLWFVYGVNVMKALAKMGPTARGRILACGVSHSANGSLAYHEVNEGHINPQVTGDELLTLLASYVVVAAIVDINRAGVQSLRDEELQREQDEDQRETARYFG